MLWFVPIHPLTFTSHYVPIKSTFWETILVTNGIFTSHYVPIKSGTLLFYSKRQLYLHPIMFLLNLSDNLLLFLKHTDLHPIMFLLNPGVSYEALTTIKYLHPIMFLLNPDFRTMWIRSKNLHPIMFLLNPLHLHELLKRFRHLHPIMFLLNPTPISCHFFKPTTFTSHYVPIKSCLAANTMIDGNDLHPIMFLLNQMQETN